jgi:uncharacterized protein with FMN-binding domain
MKRAPTYVIAGTIAGLAGVLAFHTRPATPAALPSAAPSATITHPARRAGPGPARTRRRRHPGDAGAAGAVRSAAGTTVPYGYGKLAVTVTVRGRRITSVAVTTLQTDEPYSQHLAGQVIPTLRSEVLSGQTAGIQAVSGATYTSQAYARSVQAALDSLHIS